MIINILTVNHCTSGWKRDIAVGFWLKRLEKPYLILEINGSPAGTTVHAIIYHMDG